MSTLFLVIACKPVSEFIEPVNYIETVKKIEINSPDYNNNKMINLENLVYSFLKTNYGDVTKENITWEEEGKLENDALIKASYKDAFVEIRAIKNGDFIEVKPIEIDFRDKIFLMFPLKMLQMKPMFLIILLQILAIMT